MVSGPNLVGADATLSIGFTNDSPPTTIGEDTSQIDWIVLDRNHPSQVLDISASTAAYFGENLILKFECTNAASCSQITVHDVNCYQEKLVDRAPFNAGQDEY